MGVVPGTMARPVRRTFASRVSAGHLVMVLAGVLGVLLTLQVLSRADDTRPVLVAAVDLAPGTVLDDDALTTTRISGDGDALADLFEADDLADVRGKVLAGSVPAGALVTRSDVHLVADGVAPRAMSFPLAASRAVGGELDEGDVVDVIAVDAGTKTASYVMTNVEVLDIEGEDGGPLSGGNDELTVTLAVDATNALELAAAVEGGTVSLVRTTGAPVVVDATPVEEAAP